MYKEKQSLDPPWLDDALSVIRSNGVVALPYERLFGLAANALDETAVSKVAAIKNRDEHASGPQPISIIIPSRDSLPLFAKSFSDTASDLADRYWPGLLTIVVPAADILPRPLVSVQGLVGIRLCGPSPAALLSSRANLPLTATSANLSGDSDVLCHESLSDLPGVDYVVEGTVPGPPGSTVIDASSRPLKIIRQGFIIPEEVT